MSSQAGQVTLPPKTFVMLQWLQFLGDQYETAMNERERIDVLKCAAATLALGQNLPSCVKRIATGPLATYQISVQSVEPFPRYGKGMRLRTCTLAAVHSGDSCTRANVPIINFCKTLS